jgi:hypothetical protein
VPEVAYKKGYKSPKLLVLMRSHLLASRLREAKWINSKKARIITRKITDANKALENVRRN